MFFLTSPKVVDLEVFTTLPAEYRTRTQSAWAQANRSGLPTDSFLEGPVFDTRGNLYVSDIPFGRIFRIDPSARWTLVAEYGGQPNGMKFLNDHELLITDYRNGLMVCDTRSGVVRPFLVARNSEGFKGVNDLIFDRAGNLYFTDQGQTGLHDPTGRVYRLRASGQLDLLLSNVPSPNGVALSPDERVLYVAATRAPAVWRVPLQEDGGITKVSAFFTSYGPSGPDGLAVDEAGRLIVANPGLGYVWVLNGRAEPEMVLRSTVGASLTNIAYGGPHRRTLFCTESSSGSILRAEMTVAGQALARPE